MGSGEKRKERLEQLERQVTAPQNTDANGTPDDVAPSSVPGHVIDDLSDIDLRPSLHLTHPSRISSIYSKATTRRIWTNS
jgi:hypothetical protein